MGAVAAGARQKRQGMAFSMVCSSSFLDLAIPPRTLHCGHSYPIPSTLFLPSPLHWGALGAGEGGRSCQWPTSALRFPLHLTHLSVPPRRLCAELRQSQSHSLDALCSFLP